VLEARKATINIEVLNLTELGEPIGRGMENCLYEDSLKTANQFFLLTLSFTPTKNVRLLANTGQQI